MGATTIWERWDGIKPDSTFQNAGMNSFNHYAYGAIGNWLYTQVAGIQSNPENAGYKNIIIKPVLTDKLDYAEATYKSMYGVIKSRWNRSSDKLTLSVTIPANTSAKIFIPSIEKSTIIENGKAVDGISDMKSLGYENGYFIIEAGSGNYSFESSLE